MSYGKPNNYGPDEDREVSTKCQFIDNMEDLVAYTYTHTAKFPKRFNGNYTHRIITNILLASECVDHGNDIRIDFKYWKYGKTDATYELYRKAYNTRVEYFENAISYLKTAAKLIRTGERMEIQELVEDKCAVLKEWLGYIVTESKLLKGIIKSDSRAFKRFSIAFGNDFSTYGL